jgi:hypothetical protein
MTGHSQLPEIAEVFPEGAPVGIQILAPENVAPGDRLSIRVLVENRKAGHNMTTGPLDFMRGWVHLRIESAPGEVISEWGAIDPKTNRIMDSTGVLHRSGGSQDGKTLVLEGVPLDANGQELKRHELWRKAGGTGQRVLFPRYTDSQVYDTIIPSHIQDDLTIVAEFNFRRYRQEFLDLVVPELSEAGIRQNLVTQLSVSKQVKLRRSPDE